MAQVNDCYYFSDVEALSIIDSIIPNESNNHYHFNILHKFNSVKTGYSNESVAFSVSEDFFKSGVLIDNTIFAKIIKLLQINNMVCERILKDAPKFTTVHNHEMAFICSTWDDMTICYCDQCISFSDKEVILFDGPILWHAYIPPEYFFKIKEQCKKIIKLINEIWPNKNS